MPNSLDNSFTSVTKDSAGKKRVMFSLNDYMVCSMASEKGSTYLYLDHEDVMTLRAQLRSLMLDLA